MNKNEIIARLIKNDTTVLSFSDRGSWGCSNYRGNCSGWYQAFLIWKYKVKKFAELFSGSGTGYDVAKDMQVDYVGADLNPVPVRPGILCVNALTDEVPVAFTNADFLFMHPPYGAEIRIPYAGSQYPDPTGELSKSDLGQMPWDLFIKSLNKVVMKYFSAMESGSRMGILIGDVRCNGVLHSMLTDIVKPGELDQILIKMQHNTVSGNRTYSSRNFVPIVHEYILILKKTSPYILDFQIPMKKELDIRDSFSATWRDVVFAVMIKLGKSASLSNIYKEVEGHEKTRTNPHWKDKIRQVLQKYPDFISESRGVWSLAA